MKNAEAAISSRRGGVKSLRTGGEVKKIFGLGGGITDLSGGYFCWGGSVPHYMPWKFQFLP